MVLIYKDDQVGCLTLNKFLKCLSTNYLLIKILNLFLLFSKSFLLTTLGFTWVAFALGSLSWWGPIFLQKAHKVATGSEDKQEKAK